MAGGRLYLLFSSVLKWLINKNRFASHRVIVIVPEHGKSVRAGSSSLLSLPRSLCCGRREGRVVAPSGNPKHTTNTILNGHTTNTILTEDTTNTILRHVGSTSHGMHQNTRSCFNHVNMHCLINEVGSTNTSPIQ